MFNTLQHDLTHGVQVLPMITRHLISPDPFLKSLTTDAKSCALFIANDGQTVIKTLRLYEYYGSDWTTALGLYTETKRSQQYLQQEMDIYRHLGLHQGILPYDSMTTSSIVFPYIRRGDLRKWLDKGSITTEHRSDWILSAVKTLSYVHSKGVIVGDISPCNFLVRDDNTILLCDFSGSGLIETCLARPELRYLKPKDDDTSDFSMDMELFAIGCLMYEISTGHPPHHIVRDLSVELLYKAGTFPIVEHLPYGSVIKKCWAGGYRNSAEILRALNKVSESKKLQGSPQQVRHHWPSC